MAADASSSRVVLSWNGGGDFTVERKAASGDFAAISKGSGAPAYTDAAIDAFATYVYRIKADAGVSNEITVGPPPAGFSVASPLAGAVANYKLDDEANFGVRMQLVLDRNGDPSMAYMVRAPLGDYSASLAEFVSWNRAL